MHLRHYRLESFPDLVIVMARIFLDTTVNFSGAEYNICFCFKKIQNLILLNSLIRGNYF